MEINADTNTPKNKPYHYQQNDIDTLCEKLDQNGSKGRLLYQLATGGGKTIIFAEIAKRYFNQYQKKVIVLTHRTELCRQTAKSLSVAGLNNKIINSTTKRIPKGDQFSCFVAMVETLKNRIRDGLIDMDAIGLVIVDEAHHNSFHKLLGKFKQAAVIGVTATPFSADINLPMKKFYQELILGEPIQSLIDQGFLARPKNYSYEVELNSLKTGITGDFNVSTSDELYCTTAMLDLLLHSYRSHSVKKKTLIFNNGIFTSRKVLEVFTAEGYPIRHLDNKASAKERLEILKWFKKTKGAILTSVSILTTGFDEPSVQTVILNRATTSLTLYHQMIGRGSRRLPAKKTFNIIDLGNNASRFGAWEADIDWQEVFMHPEIYHDALNKLVTEVHHISPEMRNKFPNSLGVSFDVLAAHQEATQTGQKPKIVIRDSIRQHALMCADNASGISEALELISALDKEIDWRIKQHAKCIGPVTRNYVQWLGEDYRSRLNKLVVKIMGSRSLLANTA